MIKNKKQTQEQKDYNYAIKCKNDGKYELSIECYKNLIEKNPNNILYLEELGNLYENFKLFREAIECYKKIIQNNPMNGIILNQLGICYFNLLDFENAITYFKMIIRIKNDIPDVYNNIGNCYVNLKNYKLAETVFNISLKLKVDRGILSSLANLYFYMKKYDDSILFYNKILTIQNTNVYLYNSCFPYLAKKEFKTGFKLYENRLNNNNIHFQTNQKERVEIPNIPNWNGINECNRLLIIYEQGIGDNIQYYRFIIQLSELYPNMKITYFCKDIVWHIFKNYENIAVKKNLDSIFEYDYKIYIMSLPFILKIDDVIYPNKINYINTDSEKLIYWREKFTLLKKKCKVGIVYNGLLSSFIEKFIPLKEFNTLCELDVDLICVCKLNEINEDIEKIKNTNPNIHFFDIDKDIPFTDTIAILQNIDLLITIDSAVVHLAGVLGIKTWLLLGFGSDWRWSNTNNTYWYSSVELLRMNENVELKNIMPTIKNKLSSFLLDFPSQT